MPEHTFFIIRHIHYHIIIIRWLHNISSQHIQISIKQKPYRYLKGNKDNWSRPHSHICKASIVDLSNPSLQHREDKSFLLHHSWLPYQDLKTWLLSRAQTQTNRNKDTRICKLKHHLKQIQGKKKNTSIQVNHTQFHLHRKWELARRMQKVKESKRIWIIWLTHENWTKYNITSTKNKGNNSPLHVHITVNWNWTTILASTKHPDNDKTLDKSQSNQYAAAITADMCTNNHKSNPSITTSLSSYQGHQWQKD